MFLTGDNKNMICLSHLLSAFLQLEIYFAMPFISLKIYYVLLILIIIHYES